MFESMGLEVWHIWLMAACVIAVVELLLLDSYYLLAVAGGAAVVGAIAAIIDISTAVQWLLFVVATIAMTFVLRALRSPEKKEVPDDVSYMEGKLVEVLERVSPRGRVMYKGVSWAAESEEVFEAGETARIARVDGSTLFIIKLKSGDKHG